MLSRFTSEYNTIYFKHFYNIDSNLHVGCWLISTAQIVFPYLLELLLQGTRPKSCILSLSF